MARKTLARKLNGVEFQERKKKKIYAFKISKNTNENVEGFRFAVT